MPKAASILVTFYCFISAAPAATIWVTNTGADTNFCGAVTAPCRSIRQGIIRAATLDTVMISPGRYGDLNGNNLLGEPGEEDGTGNCNCLVHVNKNITVRSELGAPGTLIEVPSWFTGPKVSISAIGAKFGAVDGGFFLKTSQGVGIAIAAANVTVTGNVIQGGAQGIVASASNAIINENHVRFVSGDGITLAANSYGTVNSNVAAGNGQSGFAIASAGSSLSFNKALSNGLHGYAITGVNNQLIQNHAVANQTTGMFLGAGATGVRFQNNTMVGNLSVGARVFAVPFTFTGNNIYGNGSTPCQFDNGTGSNLAIPNNFWGIGLPAGSVCGNPVAAMPVSNIEFIAAFPNLFGQIIVGNNGIDLAGCGSISTPCRSISFAVTQVPVNGTILVKHGRYGMPQEPNLNPMIRITKSGVTVKVHGNKFTAVMAGTPSTLFELGAASSAVEGLAFVGVNNNVGVALNAQGTTARENLFLRCRLFFGNASLSTAIRNTFAEGGVQWFTGTNVATMQENVVLGGATGIDFSVSSLAPAPLAPPNFQLNVVTGASGSGFRFNSGQASGANLTSFRNFSIGNAVGVSFTISTAGTHRLFGFHVIGNRNAGIVAGPLATSLTSVNLFANGDVPNASYPINCGVVSTGTPAAAQDFRNNYWGASTGPGGLDPADAYCSVGTIPALVTPFLTVPISF